MLYKNIIMKLCMSLRNYNTKFFRRSDESLRSNVLCNNYYSDREL